MKTITGKIRARLFVLIDDDHQFSILVKTPGARRREQGYSLIEAVMVMVFLGVAFVATLNMMSSSVSQSVDSELMTKAIALGEEKMERIVGDKTSLGYGYLTANNYPPENNPNGLNGFTRTTTITTYSTYKSIRVVVSHSKIAPLRLTTFVTNY